VLVPEAGQGALAVQVRAGEEHLVSALDHAVSRAELEAERAKVEELGGGCTVPVAAFAWHEGGELKLRWWSA
jgi:hydroxymethylbilane synthase